jgi:GMP synthase (glutamine-hydrolysing)
MHEAIGSRFHAILVDDGVMHLNECQTAEQTLTKHLGINLKVVDINEEFLGKLNGVVDPEKKRKIIGNTFIEVFQREAEHVMEESGGDVDYLLQGTLYPDVIEIVSFKGPSTIIKTHLNFGGLPKLMKLKLIEPLREFFKDEVRDLGTNLGIPDELVWRHPFPVPGIAIRILGEVTLEQIRIARLADHIYISEIKAAGLYRDISQAYAALLPVQAVDVMGDKRVHDQVIALREVTITDYMTADWYDFDGKFFREGFSQDYERS